MEPCGLIGGGGSPEIESGGEEVLQVIRPCCESETGWTPKAQTPAGTHSSLVLNERGPALNVFWILEDRDWAQDQCAGGLLLGRRQSKKKRTKKNRAGGSRVSGNRPAPFGSKVRFKHWSNRALEPDG